MISAAEARLERWAEWLMRARGTASRGQSVTWGMATSNGYKGCVVPVSDLVASRTHDWFMALDKPSQMLLVEVYCTGRTSREHATRLQMSLRTLYTRLHKLHTACLEAQTGRREPRKKSFDE